MIIGCQSSRPSISILEGVTNISRGCVAWDIEMSAAKICSLSAVIRFPIVCPTSVPEGKWRLLVLLLGSMINPLMGVHLLANGQLSVNLTIEVGVSRKSEA